jgi:hypothetical protein
MQQSSLRNKEKVETSTANTQLYIPHAIKQVKKNIEIFSSSQVRMIKLHLLQE